MRLHGSSSAELREHFLRWSFCPLAAQLFRQSADIQSVTLAVAQYWDDEAHDAVHTEILPATGRDPGWPIASEVRAMLAAHLALHGRSYSAHYGDNYDLIVAFAAYCRPSCHQEMSIEEAYTPYAIARRAADADGIVLEVVGRRQQPGWEDRFYAPSRSSPLMFSDPPIPLVEQAQAGQTISPTRLLEALEGPALLSEATGLGWALVQQARRRLDGGGCDDKVLQRAESWLEQQGVRS